MEERSSAQYNKITIKSGYNVPIFSSLDYANKIYQILADNGLLIVIGNKPCLKTNGINMDKHNVITRFAIDISSKFSLVEGPTLVEEASQHTLMADPVPNLYRIVFKKIELSADYNEL